MRHCYLDKYAEIDSYLHRLDPRIKILAVLALIVSIVFTPPEAFVSFGLYAFSLVVLIGISRIPPLFILKRSLVIVPFVCMVAIFIPFFKSGRVAGGYSFGSLRLSVTYEGLMVFWNVLIKSYLSAVSMILLMASQSFSNLLKALQSLKVPRLFTMILSFMYRYIFVVQDELMKMQQAKLARSVGGSRWLHTKTLASMVGVLFIRSYERGESVYLAMRSRGFNGEVRAMNHFQVKSSDFCFLIAVVCILAGIRLIGVR